MEVKLLNDFNVYKEGDILEVAETSAQNMFCKVEGVNALLIVPKYLCEIIVRRI